MTTETLSEVIDGLSNCAFGPGCHPSSGEQRF